MKIQYLKHYSSHLGRDMEFKIYGHSGKPILFVPCQSGRFYDFENFHMIDTWAQWIEEGRCTVYSVDSIDDMAWAAIGADNRWRIENHERWYNYVVGELVPTIHFLSGRHDILPFGCSMGAMHAANLFFRRPDLFDGVLAISGLYDSLDFFDNYMDDLVYNNSPVHYLSGMPQDHYYMDMYQHRKIYIIVGQGAWEEQLLAGTRRLEAVLQQKGIPARFEYWGHDVNHDWPWWFKMCQTYVPELL